MLLSLIQVCLFSVVAVAGLPIAAADDCDQQMMRCGLPLKVLDDNFSAGKEELDQICP